MLAPTDAGASLANTETELNNKEKVPLLTFDCNTK
jgi:hypothetical protein